MNTARLSATAPGRAARGLPSGLERLEMTELMICRCFGARACWTWMPMIPVAHKRWWEDVGWEAVEGSFEVQQALES